MTNNLQINTTRTANGGVKVEIYDENLSDVTDKPVVSINICLDAFSEAIERNQRQEELRAEREDREAYC